MVGRRFLESLAARGLTPAAGGPGRHGWLTACDLDRLSPGRGVAVLLPDGGQAALFRDRSGVVRAIGNRDPFTGAYVLSRLLLGSAGGRPFVASPLLKQRFDLATGVCLDDEEVSVPVHAVRVE
ncbi:MULTISPECIES: nitrite reductase small subunit NirD [unclassified Streptomyces]|uniref:nitrite reductase small subunit NirD n=1 Tax=unclassified Streptomyces TaxID=2593676 RepID=UPI00081E2E84|nr:MULTISPECIES: nitrite reductase small subunit NirD [unclassified Streptomyces]MYR97199.1 nitrite reductase small subunit NirD [Streptomyces sp. SID4937]SCE22130.1 nitrite reductase (NADH) small subunit [Streptomyces sp. ScaeMP-e83]